MNKERIYYVRGMHCASCELLMEKKLLELNGVKAVEASASKGEVLIKYEDEMPDIETLNKIFQKENYIFSEQKINRKSGFNKKEFFIIFGTALGIILAFMGLNKLGLSGLININSSSSLIAIFIFGALAGVSSCAALVGGMVLSFQKQWKGYTPHFMFNAGRIISYSVFGAVLGFLGSRLQFSFKFTSLLVLAVSLIMIFMALQMLGVKAFRRFQITTPKFITRYISDEKNFNGKYAPFLLGTLTFLLPCGFTITAQGLALLSGSALQGGLIMLAFALGTLPVLLAIGVFSVQFSKRPHLSYRFLKVAGLLVLFFAIYNINSQMNVLGFFSLSDVGIKNNENTVEVSNKIQVIKMDASSAGYKPSYFKVRANVPVRWEITDKGTSGCTNAVISKGLFFGEVDIKPDQTVVKEFTPTKPGRYKFSCWMGMVSGVIEVI